ncbi:YfiR family protein [Pelagicoccus sp. SDUM812003]|nr:YfiR family protein [Pelagicoccus sp. SDUM812003]
MAPLGFLMAIALTLASTACAQVFQENRLIANYLSGFGDFVRWEGVGATGQLPQTIAVLGNPSLLQELRDLSRRESENGAPQEIIATEWSLGQSLEGVGFLYIGAGYADRMQEILVEAKRSSTITVSSKPKFIEAGGLIQFLHVRNRLRFALNVDQSSEYGVHFSSKLIQISAPVPRSRVVGKGGRQ